MVIYGGSSINAPSHYRIQVWKVLGAREIYYFKSNSEFKYQIIVLSIKLRNGFAKFMILIALSKRFLS